METSKDNFQYGFRIKAGADIPTYEAVVEVATEAGYGDEGAGGSYRLMRLAGSANLKPKNNGFRSKVEYVDKETVWDLMVLAEALGLDRAEIASRAVQGDNKSKASNINVSNEVNSIDPLYIWINTSGELVKEADESGFSTIKCPWASQHTSGGDTASYSPLGLGGDYANYRAFNCFHGHCDGRDIEDYIDWAEKRGAPYVVTYDPLTVMQNDYIYVVKGPRIIDLKERKAGRDPGCVKT